MFSSTYLVFQSRLFEKIRIQEREDKRFLERSLHLVMADDVVKASSRRDGSGSDQIAGYEMSQISRLFSLKQVLGNAGIKLCAKQMAKSDFTSFITSLTTRWVLCGLGLWQNT
jgi:hypothetical protein